MAVYFVNYDLNREVRRPPIVAAVKSFGSWARLSESCYAVEYLGTAQEVFDRLRPLIDSNDNLYVIPVRPTVVGWGPPDVNKWLSERGLG